VKQMDSEQKTKLITDAMAALIKCLEGVPFICGSSSKIPGPWESNPPVEMIVEVELSDLKKHEIIVEVRNNGQPRYARDAINKLLDYLEYYPPGAYGVFIAPYISPEAAELCTKKNIGYTDLSGNCKLSFDGVYIEKKGNPNRYAEKRGLRSLYSPKAERILRTLMNVSIPGFKITERNWQVKHMAQDANVSLGHVSNVMKLLRDREWILGDKNGFVLKKPELLLAEWKDNYSFRRNEVRNFYSMSDPARIEYALSDVCGKGNIKYGLTCFSGAARLAPEVKYQRVMAYIGDNSDMEHIVSSLGLKEVSSGANVSLMIPYDEGVFYESRKMDGVIIVSPVQIYLDLTGFRGRGEEAAEALLERMLKKSW